MPQTVLCLERIFSAERCVGNVAIVASNVSTVRGAGVGGIGIGHYVAIHTRFRRIDQVGSRTGDVYEEQSQPAKDPQQDQSGRAESRSEKSQLQNLYHEVMEMSKRHAGSLACPHGHVKYRELGEINRIRELRCVVFPVFHQVVPLPSNCIVRLTTVSTTFCIVCGAA